MKTKKPTFVMLLLTYLLITVFASAQETDNRNLEKEIQNQVANLATFPFQNNEDSGTGSYIDLRTMVVFILPKFY